MKIQLPYCESVMTVHLNRPMHGLSYLCTDLTGRKIGMLYQNGNFHLFDTSDEDVYAKWQKASKTSYADWWNDKYHLFRYDRDEDMLEYEDA